MSDLFDVWELEEWKKTKEYGLLVDHKGNLCELFYPDEEEEVKECSHICEKCQDRYGCDIYYSWKDWKLERSYINEQI